LNPLLVAINTLWLAVGVAVAVAVAVAAAVMVGRRRW
jgi:hypothetical protein